MSKISYAYVASHALQNSDFPSSSFIRLSTLMMLLFGVAKTLASGHELKREPHVLTLALIPATLTNHYSFYHTHTHSASGTTKGARATSCDNTIAEKYVKKSVYKACSNARRSDHSCGEKGDGSLWRSSCFIPLLRTAFDILCNFRLLVRNGLRS